jgi:hypothetical protein
MNEMLETGLAIAGGAVAGWFGHRWYSNRKPAEAETPADGKTAKGAKPDAK